MCVCVCVCVRLREREWGRGVMKWIEQKENDRKKKIRQIYIWCSWWKIIINISTTSNMYLSSVYGFPHTHTHTHTHIYIYIYIYIYISTTLWLYSLDFNAMHGERFDGEYTIMLQAVLSICWKQPPKKEAVCPFTTNLTKYPSKTNKICCAQLKKDELISDVFLWTSTHWHIRVSWPTKTYIHQLCVDTG